MDVLISDIDVLRVVIDDVFANTERFSIVTGFTNNAFNNWSESIVLYVSNDKDVLRYVIDDVFINTDVLSCVIDDVFANTDALRIVIAEEFANNVLRFTIDALISAIDDVFANIDKFIFATDKLKDILKADT